MSYTKEEARSYNFALVFLAHSAQRDRSKNENSLIQNS